MIAQRRLVSAILFSMLLHATGSLLAAAPNLPRELTLTAKSGWIQAILAPTAAPLENGTTTPSATPLQYRVARITAASGDAPESTSSAKKLKTPGTQNSPNSDVFLPQEYLTRQPHPESELSLEDIPQPEQPGTFQMLVWINQRGETVRIETEETTAAARFIEQVTERFKTTRFIPGERHNLPVPGIIRIEISY